MAAVCRRYGRWAWMTLAILFIGANKVYADIETVYFLGTVSERSTYEGVQIGETIQGSFDIDLDAKAQHCSDTTCRYGPGSFRWQGYVGEHAFAGTVPDFSVGIQPDAVRVGEGFGSFDGIYANLYLAFSGEIGREHVW